MEARSSAAAEAGRKLSYVGLVDVAAGTCSVTLQVHPVILPLSMLDQTRIQGETRVNEEAMSSVDCLVQAYPTDHAFAQLSGSDNIIAFSTQRYSQQPLIIRCCCFSNCFQEQCWRHAADEKYL